MWSLALEVDLLDTNTFGLKLKLSNNTKLQPKDALDFFGFFLEYKLKAQHFLLWD